MTINVCPIATIEAPVERVWIFLSEPANYALWWDAQTRTIVPEGAAQVGQKIHAQTSALGRKWDVNVLVEGIEPAKHQLHLKTSLPFGITVYNHITCNALDGAKTRVSFG
jgi:hypothetical protein